METLLRQLQQQVAGLALGNNAAPAYQPGEALNSFRTWLRRAVDKKLNHLEVDESFHRLLIQVADAAEKEQLILLRKAHHQMHQDYKSWPLANTAMLELDIAPGHTKTTTVLQWVKAYRDTLPPTHPANPNANARQASGRTRRRRPKAKTTPSENSSSTKKN